MIPIKEMSDEQKQILIWLPVLQEIEAKGYNPIKFIFDNGVKTLEQIEIIYQALTVTKQKYPDWYKTTGRFIADKMKNCKLTGEELREMKLEN